LEAFVSETSSEKLCPFCRAPLAFRSVRDDADRRLFYYCVADAAAWEVSLGQAKRPLRGR
jgi:hypothetical protein